MGQGSHWALPPSCRCRSRSRSRSRSRWTCPCPCPCHRPPSCAWARQARVERHRSLWPGPRWRARATPQPSCSPYPVRASQCRRARAPRSPRRRQRPCCGAGRVPARGRLVDRWRACVAVRRLCLESRFLRAGRGSQRLPAGRAQAGARQARATPPTEPYSAAANHRLPRRSAAGWNGTLLLARVSLRLSLLANCPRPVHMPMPHYGTSLKSNFPAESRKVNYTG